MPHSTDLAAIERTDSSLDVPTLDAVTRLLTQVDRLQRPIVLSTPTSSTPQPVNVRIPAPPITRTVMAVHPAECHLRPAERVFHLSKGVTIGGLGGVVAMLATGFSTTGVGFIGLIAGLGGTGLLAAAMRINRSETHGHIE